MVLTVIPEGIDLLLSEKQSMAQIVCNELAQLTWRSSADLFVYRLTHLRDLSESWQQFDQESGIECTVDEEPPAEASEIADQLMTSVQAADKENAIIKASGMVTRSKRSTSKPNSYSKVASTNTQSSPGLCDSKRSSKLVHTGKRRGRPPGSKNAPKNPVPLVKVKEEQHSDSDTDIAEPAESDGEMGAMQAASGNTSSTVQKDDGSGMTSEVIKRGAYRCAECQRTFSIKRSLDAHMLSHASDQPDSEKCEASDKPVAKFTKPAMKASLCPACGKVFSSQNQLRIHRLSSVACKRTQVKNFIGSDVDALCSVCDRVFNSRLTLLKHLREHRLQQDSMAEVIAWVKEDPVSSEELSQTNCFSCTECESKFSTIDGICWHMRIHCDRSRWPTLDALLLQTGDFKCSVCDRQFTTENDLALHCVENVQAHECLECSRQIVSALHLRIHRLVHRMIKKPCAVQNAGVTAGAGGNSVLNHTCPFCERSFKHAVHLRNHMRMHTGEKSFVCHICARQFATKGQLKRHVLIHEGKMSFSCAHCHKQFRLRDSMQRHVRTVHSKIRRHLCTVCGWPFSEKHQLKKHMKVHARDAKAVVVGCS